MGSRSVRQSVRRVVLTVEMARRGLRWDFGRISTTWRYPAMPPATSPDKQALLRLKAEIAKDRARLAVQLALLADEASEEQATTTGRLSRVFSLMSA